MGRPREFDMDQALDAATETFWRQGYDGTSMADLMEAMGIQKGSVYKAFGSKHGLFIQVLRRYLDKLFMSMLSAVEKASTPAERIRIFIENFRTTGYDEDMRKGCLAVNAVVELAPHDGEVRALLEAHHTRVVKALSGVISMGQADGTFRSDRPAEELAAYLTVVAAGFVSTSKASLPDLDDPAFGELLFSTLQA